MTTFVHTKPATPSPAASIKDAGRREEREDVLTYLVALATATGTEELWEAVNHIKDRGHVREAS